MSRRKIALLAFTVSFLFLAVFMLLPTPVEVTATSNTPVGPVDCQIGLTGIVRNAQGNPIMNSPILSHGEVVESVDVTAWLVVAGPHLDWSTLSLSCSLFVNDEHYHTWSLPVSRLEKYAGAYTWEQTESISIIKAKVTDEGAELVSRLVVHTEAQDLTDHRLISDSQVFLNLTFTAAEQYSGQGGQAPSFVSVASNAAGQVGSSLILSWTVADDNPTAYVINTYTPADGWDIAKSGSWESGDTITYDTKDFVSIEPGDFQLRVSCTIIDATGYYDSRTALVDLTAPPPVPPTDPTEDIPYFLPTEGPSYSLEAGDLSTPITIKFRPRALSPASYQITEAGEIVASGSWDGSDISLQISELSQGLTFYTCTVRTEAGLTAYITHSIRTPTLPTIPPRRTLPTDGALPNSPFLVAGVAFPLGLAALGTIIGGLFILRRRKDKRRDRRR